MLKSVGLEWANKVLVSSAKIIGAEVLFISLVKSFIYERKSRGPIIKPCGTPCLTLAQFETLLLFSLSLYIAVLHYLLPTCFIYLLCMSVLRCCIQVLPTRFICLLCTSVLRCCIQVLRICNVIFNWGTEVLAFCV